MVRFRKDLLTGDETSAVRGEIRHEGGHFLRSSDSWNWRGQIGLQQSPLSGRSSAETETVLTTTRAPPGFASLGPVTAAHPSTGGDGLPLAQSASDVEECRRDLLMRVSMIPGAYALTVMPYFPNSCASKASPQFTNKDIGSMDDIPAACVKPRTANLDAEYPAIMLIPALMT